MGLADSLLWMDVVMPGSDGSLMMLMMSMTTTDVERQTGREEKRQRTAIASKVGQTRGARHRHAAGADAADDASGDTSASNDADASVMMMMMMRMWSVNASVGRALRSEREKSSTGLCNFEKWYDCFKFSQLKLPFKLAIIYFLKRNPSTHLSLNNPPFYPSIHQ